MHNKIVAPSYCQMEREESRFVFSNEISGLELSWPNRFPGFPNEDHDNLKVPL